MKRTVFRGLYAFFTMIFLCISRQVFSAKAGLSKDIRGQWSNNTKKKKSCLDCLAAAFGCCLPLRKPQSTSSLFDFFVVETAVSSDDCAHHALFDVSMLHATSALQGDARESMEDAHFPYGAMLPARKVGDAFYFYGIYDGHGGDTAAIFAAENLHQHLLSAYVQAPEASFPEVISTGFLNSHHAYNESAGTTAVVAIIKENILFVANAGDSRAVISDEKIARRLSCDHKPEDSKEQKRIADLGGSVTYKEDEKVFIRQCVGFNRDLTPIIESSFSYIYRVNNGLSTSRSLGDHAHQARRDKTKYPCIIPDPYISTTELGFGEEFLILGCDGLWDVITDQAAVDFVHIQMKALGVTAQTISSREAHATVNALVQFALAIWDHDNVSATIIFFKK